MKKIMTLFLICVPFMDTMAQENELTTTQAKNYYAATSKKHMTVHDPSVVWEPATKRYYIFGSHRDAAWSTDLQNWTKVTIPWKSGSNTNADNSVAFTTPQVTRVKKGGAEIDFPAFNAKDWAARTDASYNINGNMWAPDVIWNPTMQKWCMYLSINGDKWHSSIILLTSNKITGPYEYQAPVVISGFDNNEHSYKDTDLEIVLGTQSSLPSRYKTWATTGIAGYPNNIDPCVFYDENGKLWMTYGSWSGGIFILELDETTGLRDYDTSYALDTNSDPYFGKRIAGGYYVSGEAPYIEYINGYYYLFVTYGGLDSVGGYVMRVFRSKNPDGPFTDANGVNAVYSSYKMNYGKNSDNRGVKVLGAYDKWGFMTLGELSQGHNSIIAAEDGRTYLVYHTRFNDGSEGHQVRVHQMFQTKNGWLVASPFEYNGGTLADNDIATSEQFSNEQIAGTYQMLLHKYGIDYANREVVTPVKITLTADGSVSGAYNGTWNREAGTSYVVLKLGGIEYNGVLFEQQMDEQSVKTISFAALSKSGVNIWGYRLKDDYAVAWQVNNQKLPTINTSAYSKNVDLYNVDLLDDNVSIEWSSSNPKVISDKGVYNPNGLTESTPVTLTAKVTAGNYFWQKAYQVDAQPETMPTADWKSGMLAHYGFDDAALSNTYKTSEHAVLKRNGSTPLPEILNDELEIRTEKVVQLNFGAAGAESYVEVNNPLYGQDLADGATLSFWVRRLDDSNLWDALFGFYNPTTGARLYMTGNCYTGYNSNTGNWLDINHPSTVTPTYLNGTRWHLVTVVFSRSKYTGHTLYIDGTLRSNSDKVSGQLDGTDITMKYRFDINLIVDHIASCEKLYLGYGSFWGSAPACFDDVIIYNRALSKDEVGALTTMENRVYRFSDVVTGISQMSTSTAQPVAADQLYDMSGRRITGKPAKGMYIRSGRKVIIK